MKYNVDEYSGVICSSKSDKFRYSDSPIIFQILSNNLYENKIGSIIRELCSNARDAHIAVGKKDVPFEVMLPVENIFSEEITFQVIDHGTGLSEEDIYNIYTVYGESSKRDSNNFIGGFGIGSKSPFAYTDYFTIISNYNGKKYTYHAYINNQGFPAITKISEVDTSNENGLTISIPVKKDDIVTWIEEYTNQIQFFDPLPVTNFDVEIEKPDFLEKHAFWGILGKTSFRDERPIDVVVNCVKYTIAPKDITDILGNDEATIYDFLRFSHLKKMFFIPIGVIDLTASREYISYTEKTKKYLHRLFKRFINDFKKYCIEYANTHSLYDRNYMYFGRLGIQKIFKDLEGYGYTYTVNADNVADVEKIRKLCRSRLIKTFYKLEYNMGKKYFLNKFETLPKYQFVRCNGLYSDKLFEEKSLRNDLNYMIIQCPSKDTDISELIEFFGSPSYITIDSNIPVKQTVVKQYSYYISGYVNNVSSIQSYNKETLQYIYDAVTSGKYIIIYANGIVADVYPGLNLNESTKILNFFRCFNQKYIMLPKSTVTALEKETDFKVPTFEEYKKFYIDKFKNEMRELTEEEIIATFIKMYSNVKNFFDLVMHNYTDEEVTELKKEYKIFDIMDKYYKQNIPNSFIYYCEVYLDEILKTYQDIYDTIAEWNKNSLIILLGNISYGVDKTTIKDVIQNYCLSSLNK